MTDSDRKLVEKCWKFALPTKFQVGVLASQCANDGTSDASPGLESEYLKIWDSVPSDTNWHDLYFHGEESLYYYNAVSKETTMFPKEFIPRWLFVAISVREAISHGFGDFEFVEDAIRRLLIVSENLLWPTATQDIDECLGLKNAVDSA